MKNHIRIIFACLLFVTGLHAQTFRGLSVKDGLPELIVNAIYKDSTGYVWMGTNSSVVRFDGIGFKHYALDGNDEWKKEVSVIAGMPGNEVWVGNNTGLWRIEGDSVVRLFADRINARVFAMTHDEQGTCYVGTDRGLWICRGDSAKQVLVDPNVFSLANKIKGVALDKTDHLWMITDTSLYRMSLSNQIVTVYEPEEIPALGMFTCVYTTGEEVYLGTQLQGILLFNPRTAQFAPWVNVGHVTSLSGDDSATLYVGSNGDGIYFISTRDKKVLRNIRHNPHSSDGLRSNSVYSLLVDREGIIWAGLFQFGVDYSLYQRSLFTTWQPACMKAGFTNYAVRSMEITPDEQLVGTRDGLFYFRESRGICRDFTEEMRSPLVYCTHVSQGKYYIGTQKGMYVFNPQEGVLRDFFPDIPDPFISGQIFSITSDREGNLWVGTSNGVYSFAGGKLKYHFHTRNSRLSSNSVYCVYFDSANRGWFCTGAGVGLMPANGERLIVDAIADARINSNLIRTVYEDTDKNLYFLPNKGNLLFCDFELTQFQEVRNTPFDNKKLEFIIEDEEHWLWIGTNDGLYRYDKSGNTVSYNFSDGIPTPIFLSCPPKKCAEGALWFGSSRGVFYTDLKRINGNLNYPYALGVTSVSLNGGQVPFSYDNSKKSYIARFDAPGAITFHFSNFSYTDPQYMVYECKLEGVDDYWKSVTGESSVTYHSLSAGSYQLLLRNPGSSNSMIRLHFTVSSDTGWWLYAINILLLIAAACLGGYYVRRKLMPASATAKLRQLADSNGEKESSNSRKTATRYESKYRTANISTEECELLVGKLKQLMQDEKPYVESDFQATDLARMLGISIFKLSYLFNQHLKTTYYDYINDYRIREFKSLVDKKEFKYYTINSLMERCGFTSHSSFSRSFKSITGYTPSEYIKLYGKQ